MSKKLFSKFIVLLLVVGLLFAVAPTKQAQAATPITLNVAQWSTTVPVGVAGRPTVLLDGANYHLWYGPDDTTLYHSVSTDPAAFPAGSLVTFSGRTPFEVASTAIFIEGTTFYMVAYGPTNQTFDLYSSPDGAAWTFVKEIFTAVGMPDLNKIDAPFVFNDDGTYKLYFQKKKGTTLSYDIFLATSATVDGTYTLANGGTAVFSPTTAAWDGVDVMHPWVVKDGTTYYMWYSGYGGAGNPQRIGFATSPDGINWTKSPANPIIGPVGEPSVIKNGATWQMWYLGAGNAVQYVSATGPFEFQTIQDAVAASAAGDVIKVAAGTYNIGTLVVPHPLSIIGAGDTTIVNGKFQLTNAESVAGTYLFQTMKFPVTNSSITVTDFGHVIDEVKVDNVTFDTNLDNSARAIGVGPDNVSYRIKKFTVLNSRFYSTLAIYLTGDIGAVEITGNEFHVTDTHWKAYNAININQSLPASASVDPAGTYIIQNNQVFVPGDTYSYAGAITNMAYPGSVFDGQPGGKELTASGNTITVGAGAASTDQSLFVKDLIANTNDLYPVHNVTQHTWFTTIQAAIDATSTVAGDIIEVSAGIYPEAVNVNKSVTITGTGEIETFTDPTVVNDWYTDRYEPEVFVVDTFLGESVLKHGVVAADFQTDTFYNYQGKKFDIITTGPEQTWSIDLFVDPAWETGKANAGFWATGYASDGTISAYPMVAWRSGGTDPAGFYSFDYINGGWLQLFVASANDYGKWHNFAMTYTVGTGVEYFVDGVSRLTFADQDTAKLSNIILNIYNFGEDYNVYWDNFAAHDTKVIGQMSINASDVAIEGLILSNPGQTYGMLIDDAVSNIDITENIFEDIGSPTLSQNVKGVYLQYGPDDVLIQDNLFQRIHANTNSVNAIFSGDTNSTSPAETLKIQDNRFLNITSQTKGGYGILLNNGAGNPGAVIEGNSFNGISGGWTHAIGLEGPTPNALINRNVFSGLTAGSVDNTAVFFEANSGIVTTSITNNQFLNSGFGVAVHPNMTNHAPVLASPNWWGQLTGPATEQLPPSGDYDSSPWCANAACTEFLPAMATIAPVAPVVCGNTTTTTIDVNISGIPTGMIAQGYQLTLHFDPTKTSIASVDNIAQGGFLPLSTGFTVRTIDNVNGTVVIASTIFGTATNNPALPLAKITLTHKGLPGDINLTLSDVLLSDADGLPIPADGSTTPVVLTLNPAVLNVTKDPDVGYCTLAEAVTAADAGDVLQLQADIAIPLTVTVDKAITLDLNGKVASYTPVNGENFALQVTTGGVLTIEDTATGGTIRAIGGYGRGINVNGGSLLVNSGSIQGEYASVNVQANSSMTLAGGSIGGVNGTILYSGIGVTGSGATLTVTGGTIESYDFAIYGIGNAENWGTIINIQGGEVISTGPVGEAIYHPQSGTLNISGGTITGHQGVEMRNGTLNVTGGTIHAIGNYVAVPDLKGGWSTDTGDAIYVGTSGTGYGNVVVNISGTPIITSDNGFALREAVLEGVTFTNTQLINVTGGTFTGGTGTGEAGAAVKFDTVDPATLKLTGGLYNTDPADNGALVDPVLYVFVPYGTKYNGTMYEIVSISVHFNDFYYVKNATMLGVTGEVTATNFLFSEASSVVVKLYSGTAGNYVLLQTNVLKTPASYPNSGPLGSPFNIFGTYQTSSWTNTHEAEYGQHVAPTHIEVTVVVPTGTLTAYADNPGVYTYPDIQPSILISDFGYWDQSGVRGLSAGVGATNFNFNQATDIKLELFAGTQLLQTNTAPSTSPLFTSGYTSISGPFDIFGTFDYGNDGYWSNVRQSEYGQTVVPTKVVATVTLPGDVILTAVRENPTGDRTTILPGVSGLVTLQGILTPKADVKLTLTSGAVVRDTFSTVQSSINYGFTGVETLTYTFTTSQARYLNVTTESGKTFLVNRDLTLTPLRLYGGDVDQNNNIQVNDASLVGTDWGSTLNPEANINYDGIVNIQDLALVGGNYLLTSATAYSGWIPFTTP